MDFQLGVWESRRMEMNMRIMMQRKIRNKKHKAEEENDIFFGKWR